MAEVEVYLFEVIYGIACFKYEKIYSIFRKENHIAYRKNQYIMNIKISVLRNTYLRKVLFEFTHRTRLIFYVQKGVWEKHGNDLFLFHRTQEVLTRERKDNKTQRLV